MLISALLLVHGVLLLLLSTQIFIKEAEKMSAFLRMSPLIVGLTVVSLGTSLPELVISLLALVSRDPGLALANIIGSNIINVFLILGTGILVGKLRIGTTKTQRNIFLYAVLILVFMVFNFIRPSAVFCGAILLFFSLVFTFEQYMWGVKGRNCEDIKYCSQKPTWFSFFDFEQIILVLIGIIVGGILTVSSVEQLATFWNLSTTPLGLSVTAIATSLPELLTTIFSQKNQEEKITIGNILGSNVYNLALIGGIILFFSSWQAITSFEITSLFLSALVFFAITFQYRGKVVPRFFGLILLVFFGLYILFALEIAKV